MDIERLRELVKLGEHLNYTRAAQELFMAQSTLSEHMASLEKELGLKLVDRSSAGVNLTDPGWILFDNAQRILDIYDSALAACKRATTESVMVRVSDVATAYGLAPLFDAAAKRLAARTGTALRFSFVPSRNKTVEALLADGDCDIGFVAACSGEKPVLEDGSGLAPFFVATLPLQLYAAPGSPIARAGSPSLDDLAGKRIVVSNQPLFRSDRECIRRALSRLGVSVSYKMFRAESQFDRLPLDDESLLLITPAYLAIYQSIWNGDDGAVPVDIEGLEVSLDYYGVRRQDASRAIAQLAESLAQ